MRTSFTKFLMAGASLLALATPALVTPAWAQSTGTQAVETVVVTADVPSINGLMNAAPISKEQSTITKDFLNSVLPAGQTVFQALNYMPGVNFTNNDPYGTSGGDIRIHGQDGNHISLTLDGMPLNDTGNYAVYTNQMIDPEVIDRVSVERDRSTWPTTSHVGNRSSSSSNTIRASRRASAAPRQRCSPNPKATWAGETSRWTSNRSAVGPKAASSRFPEP